MLDAPVIGAVPDVVDGFAVQYALGEPTGDLDRKSADEIMGLIEALVAENKKTVLMVTHDPLVAARAHIVLHLEKGALVEGTNPPHNPSPQGDTLA